MKKIILSTIIVGTALFADGATEMVKDAAISKAKSEVTKAVMENVSSDNVEKAVAVKNAAEEVSAESNLTDKIIDAVKEKAKDAGTEAVEKAKTKAIEQFGS